MNVAFAAALTLHLFLLLIKIDISQFDLPVRSERALIVELQQTRELQQTIESDQKFEEQPTADTSTFEAKQQTAEPVSELVEEALIEKPAVEKLRVEAAPLSESRAIENDLMSVSSNDAVTNLVIPSIDSREFRQFIETEVQRNRQLNSEAVDDFSETFQPPVEPKLKDIKQETGSLGGGNYKVRRNGVVCETLTMVPQTFDQINGANIRTSGNCKEVKKKFNLVDENGKIRNSDHQDW